LLNRVGRDPELAQALGRCLTLQGEMRPLVVILRLPLAELGGQLARGPKDLGPIELVLIGPMTPFDLAVCFGAPCWDVSVGNPEVSQMPGEVGAELGAVVGLNALNRDRQSATKLVDKGRRGADRVVGIDLQDPVARRFVYGREL
jgi:hypothetical protein